MTQENELDINNQEQNKGKLTHFNEAGEAHMVDVHAKDDTYRVAKACGTIKVNGAVYRAVSTGTAKKGDVLAVARIAGIMGAKNNSMLIPLCHAIAMTKCDVEFELDEKTAVSRQSARQPVWENRCRDGGHDRGQCGASYHI